MKKILTLIIALATAPAFAQFEFCGTHNVVFGEVQQPCSWPHKWVTPQKVDLMLQDIQKHIPDEQLKTILSPEDFQSLKNYSKLDKNQIYANAYVAAAAAGAAVAVVDYVWGRYVGKETHAIQNVDESYFDLQPRQIDPVALTPVVGQAVAGAVAYNASKWALKEVFGARQLEPINLDDRQFDLQYQR